MTPDHLPPDTRPFTVGELADLVRHSRAAVHPERWTHRWTALLAPIGELDDGGLRMFSAGGQWSLPDGGAPVVDLADDGRVVGKVLHLWVEGWSLMAAGVIDPDVDLTGLSPQVDLTRMETMMGGRDQSVMIVRAALVIGISLGTAPAFPSVWIRHDTESGAAF